MPAIEFYFDPISPFAYLGSIEIERVAARLGREVVWKPVLIGITILKVMGLKPLPETPLKGPYLRHDAIVSPNTTEYRSAITACPASIRLRRCALLCR